MVCVWINASVTYITNLPTLPKYHMCDVTSLRTTPPFLFHPPRPSTSFLVPSLLRLSPASVITTTDTNVPNTTTHVDILYVFSQPLDFFFFFFFMKTGSIVNCTCIVQNALCRSQHGVNSLTAQWSAENVFWWHHKTFFNGVVSFKRAL